MRKFLLACGLLLVVGGLGAFLGLTAFPSGAGKSTDSPTLSGEPQVVREKEIPTSGLYLPSVAVVDLPRLIAAHPWTARHEESFSAKLSAAQSLSETQAQASAKRLAEFERDQNRKLVVSDIQRIIAAYGATNHLRLVLDRSASPLPDRPVVEYSSNKLELIDIPSAPGVKNITPAILQRLASEQPNNGLQRTRR